MNHTEFYKKLIKPIRDENITKILESANLEVFSPWDQQLTWAERLTPIKQLRDNFTKWADEWLTSLDKLPFMYVMNGNTDSLNNIFQNSKGTMSWIKDDYSYYAHWHNQSKKQFKELNAPTDVDDIVVSWPGYSWGNRDQLEFARNCNATRMHLDCAYLGLVKPDTIDVSDFETVSISFSKTLAIPYNRISLLFSKNEIPNLTLMNNLGYVNLAGVKLSNYIISNLKINYWWDNYSIRLEKLCAENNLRKTDCILFAYNGDNRISLAEYWKTY